MKRLLFYSLLLFVFAISIQQSYAQRGSRVVDNDLRDQVSALISERNFTLTATTAMPMGGPSKRLDGSYGFQVKNDSVYSYLPYYGRAFSVPYGGGEGLNFDGLIHNYTVEQTKRNNTRINLSVVTKEDTYKIMLEIGIDGGALIQISPNNKQGMTFNATLELSR